MRVIKVAAAQMGAIQKADSREAVVKRMVALMDSGAHLLGGFEELGIGLAHRARLVGAVPRGSFESDADALVLPPYDPAASTAVLGFDHQRRSTFARARSYVVRS